MFCYPPKALMCIWKLRCRDASVDPALVDGQRPPSEPGPTSGMATSTASAAFVSTGSLSAKLPPY